MMCAHGHTPQSDFMLLYLFTLAFNVNYASFDTDINSDQEIHRLLILILNCNTVYRPSPGQWKLLVRSSNFVWMVDLAVMLPDLE
jgi:hypothetical protein